MVRPDIPRSCYFLDTLKAPTGPDGSWVGGPATFPDRQFDDVCGRWWLMNGVCRPCDCSNYEDRASDRRAGLPSTLGRMTVASSSGTWRRAWGVTLRASASGYVAQEDRRSVIGPDGILLTP